MRKLRAKTVFDEEDEEFARKVNELREIDYNSRPPGLGDFTGRTFGEIFNSFCIRLGFITVLTAGVLEFL